MDMKTQSFAGRLLGTTSLVVLSAVATIAAQGPAGAQSATDSAAATSISTGVFGGGSTLSSLALRQIFDCYAGTTVANDGNTFSSSFTTSQPSPNLLPTSCTLVSTAVEGLFAAVGSGNGQRAYIADDARQLFRGSPTSAPATVKKPSAMPPFVDTANSNFSTYPYPRLDFAASDAALPGAVASLTTVSFGNFTPSTNWQNHNNIRAHSSTVASYNTAAVGAPIQVPVMEVPVAIAVNTANKSSRVAFTSQSALSPNTQAGGAIQLSASQLCAIFSATVTDWADTTTLIPFLDKTGVQQFEHFFDDNTNGTLTPVAYANHRLPIKVVYRTDESGSTFNITNYLANLCPLLDPTDTFKYKEIFTGVGITQGGTVTTTPNLPSSTFANLIDNIQAVKGNSYHDTLDVDADFADDDLHWIGADSANQQAIKISTDAKHSGRIGYLSTEFTQPYATTVTEEIGSNMVSAPAPLSASIQNERQRLLGVYHPGQTGTSGALNFIAPTPNNAGEAFRSLTAPSLTASYNAWNIYAQVYRAGSVTGGVNYSGLSVIGIPLASLTAYPFTGVSYVELYSCYADPTGTRVPALKNWLAWVLGGSNPGLPPYNPATSNANAPGFDPNVSLVLRNNGLRELSSNWANNAQKVYVTASAAGGEPTAIAAFNASGTQVDGCTGVTGGAD
jgi:ABC-type phosphate transport system substrate-binding protein